ncbi:MAG: hypothetical protein AB8C13_09750 [Phycisphaerales bacterium]
MSDSTPAQTPQSSGQSESNLAVRFLTETSPPKILLSGAIALILAAICTYIGLSLQNGLSFGQIQRMLEQGSISIPRFVEDEPGPVKHFVGLLLLVVGFLSGVAGGLLPMWSVGRLISDAICTGSKP